MILTSGSLLVGPDVIRITAEQEYWDSIYAFIPLTVSVFINFMYIFSVGIEYFHKKTGYISSTTLICTVSNILLNYILILRYGYIAAAYATCLSKLLLFILHYIRAKRLLRDDIVSLKYLIVNLIFVCLAGASTVIFINQVMIRYLLAGGMLLFVWGFYKARKTE